MGSKPVAVILGEPPSPSASTTLGNLMYGSSFGYWCWTPRSSVSVRFLDSCPPFNDLTIPSRLIAKEGNTIALVARSADSLKALSDDINTADGTAASFPISTYGTMDTNATNHAHYQGQLIHVALYNPGHGVWKPSLDITPWTSNP